MTSAALQQTSSAKPYLEGITAFHDALENLVHTIPVFDEVLDAGLDKILEKTDVPRAISIYAASYCSLSSEVEGEATSDCFVHKSTFFDVAAGLRVYIAILYLLGATSSVASLVFLSRLLWKDNPRYRNWAALFTLVAMGAALFASLITSMLACAVYMIFSGNLPKSLLSVTVSPSFLVSTWVAVACLTLVLSTILPRTLSQID
ncbi:hypothetical protein J3E72DRAFT_273566 [Bipolaris maydis]|nr:hypothetical protein J3E72DRAFT_273566 [Bipolaris maydis]